MNLPIPLFALLAARQANDSSADSGRVALLSMMVRPPMGLLLGLVMARQASRPPAVLDSKTAASGSDTLQGRSVLDQVAPETDLHSFLPSFIGFTRKQANEFAKELLLTLQFIDDPSADSARSKPGVIGQEPAPGAGWPKNRIVTLTLGSLLPFLETNAPRSRLRDRLNETE